MITRASFVPQPNAQGVELLSPIVIKFPQPVVLGEGTVTFAAQTLVAAFYLKSKGTQTLFKRDTQHITLDVGRMQYTYRNEGLSNMLTPIINASLSPLPMTSAHVHIEDSQTMVIQPPVALAPESNYTVTFDETMVFPAMRLPSLKFQTVDIIAGRPGNFSYQCDPWKHKRQIDVDVDYDTLGAWSKCPIHLRSVSGCGDFVDDSRQDKCAKPLPFHPVCEDSIYKRQVWSWIDDSYFKKQHVCFNEQIHHSQPYLDLMPPAGAAAHRPFWPKYGEYEFLPMARWLHTTEHGALAVIYNKCMPETDVCRLRKYFQSYPPDETGELRYVMTPSRSLHPSRGRFAIVAFGHTYLGQCFDPAGMTSFIRQHYRQSMEDIPFEGVYDYLHIDSPNMNCGAASETRSIAPASAPMTIVVAGAVFLPMLWLIARLPAVTRFSTHLI